MKPLRALLLAATGLACAAFPASAEPKVIASVKPVHSLVAAVMEGVGEPELIVDGASSPHTYSLKPSQAARLQDADVIFWVGHELEAFLEKPIETIAADAKSVALLGSHGLIKRPFREGGAFDAHDHGDHDSHDDHDHDEHAHEEHGEHGHDDHAEEKHDDHDEHAHDDHDDHDDHAHEEHEEHGHEENAHGAFDAHVWLDPVNAKAFVHEIEETLAAADPANAEKYESNAKALTAKLDDLVHDVEHDLEPVRGRGFIVFHDAYQYFEKRFDMTAAGSITVSPDVRPGADRIHEIREKVTGLKAACVFSEPQFEPKLVSVIVEGTSAKSGVLDPLGAGLEAGPDMYFNLIRDMAKSFRVCLTPSA